jgi:hypothetical protein
MAVAANDPVLDVKDVDGGVAGFACPAIASTTWCSQPSVSGASSGRGARAKDLIPKPGRVRAETLTQRRRGVWRPTGDCSRAA